MEENWSTLTTQEVLGEFTPQEQAVLKAIQGAGDKLGGILGRVVSQVREAFRSGGRLVGDEGTVPDSARSRAIAMARWKWLISIPSAKALQTKERKDASQEAEEWLGKVETREIKAGGAAQIVTSQTRRMTRGTLDGL